MKAEKDNADTPYAFGGCTRKMRLLSVRHGCRQGSHVRGRRSYKGDEERDACACCKRSSSLCSLSRQYLIAFLCHAGLISVDQTMDGRCLSYCTDVEHVSVIRALDLGRQSIKSFTSSHRAWMALSLLQGNIVGWLVGCSRMPANRTKVHG